MPRHRCGVCDKSKEYKHVKSIDDCLKLGPFLAGFITSRAPRPFPDPDLPVRHQYICKTCYAFIELAAWRHHPVKLKSLIKDAGFGLFATWAIAEGEVITQYGGGIITKYAAKDGVYGQTTHVKKLLEGYDIDGSVIGEGVLAHPGYAQYCNQDESAPNAELVRVDKANIAPRIDLVALVPIAPGQEIFVSYDGLRIDGHTPMDRSSLRSRTNRRRTLRSDRDKRTAKRQRPALRPKETKKRPRVEDDALSRAAKWARLERLVDDSAARRAKEEEETDEQELEFLRLVETLGLK